MSGDGAGAGAGAADEARWRTAYDAFPVNAEHIWLSNAGVTPANTRALAAVTAYLGDFARHGTLSRLKPFGKVEANLRGLLAGMMECHPGEVALVHHTAEALNFVSHGLDLAPGDEILLLENEYPSNHYPWEHWAGRGVRLVTVPLGRSPGEFLDGFRAALGPRVRLAAMTAVHWCTGMPMPLAEMGALCRERDCLLAVDATQGLGMVDIRPHAQGIDFLASSAWKWLLGPLGVGVLYVDAARLEALRPVFKGTDSVPSPERYLPYRTGFRPGAERFTYSTPNFTDWVYFEASLEFLREFGFAEVRTRIHALAARLSAGLRDRGYALASDAFPEVPTGIVAASRPDRDAAARVAELMGAGIVAVERLGRIRFAPHIYNSLAQMDRVVEALAA